MKIIQFKYIYKKYNIFRKIIEKEMNAQVNSEDHD